MIIKSKPIDSVHLSGKVIGIYKKGNKQITKVLFQSSIVDFDFDGSEALLGEDVLLETYVNLNDIMLKKAQSGKSKPVESSAKSAHRKAG